MAHIWRYTRHNRKFWIIQKDHKKYFYPIKCLNIVHYVINPIFTAFLADRKDISVERWQEGNKKYFIGRKRRGIDMVTGGKTIVSYYIWHCSYLLVWSVMKSLSVSPVLSIGRCQSPMSHSSYDQVYDLTMAWLMTFCHQISENISGGNIVEIDMQRYNMFKMYLAECGLCYVCHFISLICWLDGYKLQFRSRQYSCK